RRLKNAGADGVDEVGPLHSAQRGADLAEVEQIAVDDLDAPLLEPLRPVILPVGQRPDPVAAGQQFVDRRPAGVPRRAGDQDLAMNHLNPPLEATTIVVDVQVVGAVVPPRKYACAHSAPTTCHAMLARRVSSGSWVARSVPGWPLVGIRRSGTASRASRTTRHAGTGRRGSSRGT